VIVYNKTENKSCCKTFSKVRRTFQHIKFVLKNSVAVLLFVCKICNRVFGRMFKMLDCFLFAKYFVLHKTAI